MRARSIVLVTIACSACGRVAFDPLAHSDADDSGQGACAVDTPFEPPVLVASLNSAGIDVTLRLEANELSGLFWSSRGGDADIYAATRTALTDSFTATIVGSLNAPGVDADPTVPPDGGFVVLASGRAGGMGSFDLYEAQRTGTLSYSAPVNLGTINTTSTDGQPNWAPAEGALYFSSDRSGTSHLYRSMRLGPGSYGAPALVNDIFDAAQQDYDPVPSRDGLTLYFRSSRGGDSNGDVYVTTRTTLADPWRTPTRVEELTSTAVDGPSFLSPDRCRLYMTSDRSGMPHLYVASRAN